ncbi:hypothetical protein SAMN02745784_02992 [Tissierella praeacuta DSM 18095]|uniref:Uncharacterized protein n=1 Tax=Tissierella praeacuta DSM 18095 TaxID=1123404 RepID=A0A1M4ZBW9_9FIRM|nr:hypothetical protein [Tissierella praeacuta]SHF15458.1 hypothetical protein SAMN02745784_02992 [Tissierella praeacuta DSM 18095]SUO99558.1 Uncharacterised protein [Tissierella praeacuta]
MKLPFPDWLLVTPIKVITEIPGEDGVEEHEIFNGKCNFNEKSKTVINAERQLVTLSGSCIFKGDIYPNKPIKGYVTLLDSEEKEAESRQIYNYRKIRNPDGSIYSTELDLM